MKKNGDAKHGRRKYVGFDIPTVFSIIFGFLFTCQSIYMGYLIASNSNDCDDVSILPPDVPAEVMHQTQQKEKKHGMSVFKPRTFSLSERYHQKASTMFLPSLDPNYTGPIRVFSKWKYPFPCAEWEGAMKRTSTQEGFLYLKEIKTASTTLAGVTIRIARNMAKRLGKYPSWEMCRARFHHMRARKFEMRNKTGSFLWTIVRHPSSRLLSKFFHIAVSRQGANPSGSDLSRHFKSYRNWILDHAYYLKTMTPIDINPREISMYHNYTQMLLDEYDFIGISERLDESLVVLKLLLGLETGDILYIPAKTAKTFEFMSQKKGCSYIFPKFITPEMEQVLESNDWMNYTEADRIIYTAASHSLDATIESLGRSVVAFELEKFRLAQRLVKERCSSEISSLCNEDAQDKRDEAECLFNDSGCGYKCIDRVAQELSTIGVE